MRARRSAIGVLMVLGNLGFIWQTPATKDRVAVVDHTGAVRGRIQPRAAKPTQEIIGLGDVAVFFQEQDTRDEKGRVVSGLGFVAWSEAKEVRVRVYALVPKPGAPNVYLASKPELTSSLQPVLLTEVSLQTGQSKAVSEMKKFNVEPLVLRLGQRQSVSRHGDP